MTRVTLGWGLAVLLLSGCAPSAPARSGSAPTAGPRTTTVLPTPRFPAYSATATVPSVAVHAAPGGLVTVTHANPQPSGAPLVFLEVAERPGWVQVQLPIRPNGSTGWVRAADVTVAGVAYRLEVRRARHQLEVYRFGQLERTFPVGIGTSQTPTPGGTFYLKELLQPPTSAGPYGPFAYGLSGFSNTLRSFAGGDGVIGIHGTDHPELVGRDVSHGCIRLRNADITVLAHELPLGTPVRIFA